MNNQKILSTIKGGLIVSCQALEDEPLHSSYIMSRMAYAAKEGGAVGIRANSVEDIKEIKKTVDLPVIGIIKHDCADSPVRITPTIEEIKALIDINVDIIATDATKRIRTAGVSLDNFFNEVRAKYPNQLFMADCSTLEEAVYAEKIGFDIVGTTLRGYTDYTANIAIPDFDMLTKLVKQVKIPVIAEGGIWYPEQLRKAFESGAYSAVVGTAITRPRDITKRFVAAIEE